MIAVAGGEPLPVTQSDDDDDDGADEEMRRQRKEAASSVGPPANNNGAGVGDGITNKTKRMPLAGKVAFALADHGVHERH